MRGQGAQDAQASETGASAAETIRQNRIHPSRPVRRFESKTVPASQTLRSSDRQIRPPPEWRRNSSARSDPAGQEKPANPGSPDAPDRRGASLEFSPGAEVL